uniref:Arf-GAP domain-containing protein n=2 Tax=Macrostomum lignano TaxID=282301 RepID=A0A1I8GE05_9PLAT
MDKWKDIELEKMRVGGNRQAREFLSKQPDWNQHASLHDRYNSRAAALYKDKIATEAEGRPWNEETSAAKMHKSFTVATFQSYQPASSPPQQQQRSQYSGGAAGGGGGGGYQSAGAANLEAWLNDEGVRSRKDEFFNRKQVENAARRDDLPPSQGGRYTGFGNTPDPPGGFQDGSDGYTGQTLRGLQSGWSVFSSGATRLASAAAKKTKELSANVNEKVKEGTLLNSVGSGVSNVASKVSLAGTKSWKSIEQYWHGGGGGCGGDYGDPHEGTAAAAAAGGSSASGSMAAHAGSGGYGALGGSYQGAYQGAYQQPPQQQQQGDDSWADWGSSGWDSPARQSDSRNGNGGGGGNSAQKKSKQPKPRQSEPDGCPTGDLLNLSLGGAEQQQEEEEEEQLDEEKWAEEDSDFESWEPIEQQRQQAKQKKSKQQQAKGKRAS